MAAERFYDSVIGEERPAPWFAEGRRCTPYERTGVDSGQHFYRHDLLPPPKENPRGALNPHCARPAGSRWQAPVIPRSCG